MTQPPDGRFTCLLRLEDAAIDMANAGGIGKQLAAALTPGVRVVIADMTATTFCDTLGISMLMRGCRP